MAEAEKDPEYYADLAREKGIGVLNDWETAVRREIELQEDRISTFVEDAEQKVEAAYSETDTPPGWEADLLEWIEAAIPGENPELYLDGGPAEEYAADVLPHLVLADEERREEWTDLRDLVRRCRTLIKMLNGRLRAIQSAREKLLFNHELIGSEDLPDIFEGRPTLRSHAAEIVGEYRSDPASLPEGRGAMGKFRENWVPDTTDEEGNIETGSSSKVNQIQRAIRKVGLSDEYSDSDPESFCDFMERLLERHDTERP
ncbi:MAG: hypothetical protein ABEI52_04670 [Halobacteriaceae archaeon]